MPSDPTLALLLTVAGAATVTSILVEVIVRAAGTGFNTDRFGPLLAIIVGIIVTVVATAALGLATTAGAAQAVLTGIFAGASAMGIHDTVSGTIAGGSGG